MKRQRNAEINPAPSTGSCFSIIYKKKSQENQTDAKTISALSASWR